MAAEPLVCIVSGATARATRLSAGTWQGESGDCSLPNVTNLGDLAPKRSPVYHRRVVADHLNAADGLTCGCRQRQYLKGMKVGVFVADDHDNTGGVLVPFRRAVEDDGK